MFRNIAIALLSLATCATAEGEKQPVPLWVSKTPWIIRKNPEHTQRTQPTAVESAKPKLRGAAGKGCNASEKASAVIAGQGWLSEKLVLQKIGKDIAGMTFEDMITKDLLEIRQDPDCPKRVQYKIKSSVLAENVESSPKKLDSQRTSERSQLRKNLVKKAQTQSLFIKAPPNHSEIALSVHKSGAKTEKTYASVKKSTAKRSRSKMEKRDLVKKAKSKSAMKNTAVEMITPVKQTSSLAWLAEQARTGAKELSTGMARKLELPLMTMRGLLKLEAMDRDRLLNSMGTSHLVLQRIDDSVKTYSAADVPNLIASVAKLTSAEADELQSIMKNEALRCDNCNNEQIVQKIADTRAFKEKFPAKTSHNSLRSAMETKPHVPSVEVHAQIEHVSTSTCHSHCYQAEKPFSTKCKWRHCGECFECRSYATMPMSASQATQSSKPEGGEVQLQADHAAKIHSDNCATACYNVRHASVPWEQHKCHWSHCSGCQECLPAPTSFQPKSTPEASTAADDIPGKHTKVAEVVPKITHAPKHLKKKPAVRELTTLMKAEIAVEKFMKAAEEVTAAEKHTHGQKAKKVVHEPKASGVTKPRKATHTSKNDDVTPDSKTTKTNHQVVKANTVLGLRLDASKSAELTPKSTLKDFANASVETVNDQFNVSSQPSTAQDMQAVEKHSNEALIKIGRLPEVTAFVSKPSQVLQALNAQLGDLKRNLAVAEAANHKTVAAQKAEYENRLKAQHENTTNILKVNKQLGLEISGLKDQNAALRAEARSLQEKINTLQQTMKAFKANISIAQEFIVNSLSKHSDDENTLAVLSELAAQDVASSEKKAHDAALAAVRASNKGLSLVQVAGADDFNQSAFDFVRGLQQKFGDLDREQNSSATSLYEEFNSQFAEESRIQEAALEEQRGLLQNKLTQTELHEQLTSAVHRLKPLMVELEAKVENLRGFAERVSH